MNETRYKNKYRIDSARLADYDYGSNGIYFVAICTRQKEHFFGDIVETQYLTSLRPTIIGQQAIACWMAIPEHYPFIYRDEFQIMPNHVHGLLSIDKPDQRDWQSSRFGPQSRNLATIIRGYKIGVTKYANQAGINFGWQPRYHDRIVRNADELVCIRHYIVQNPANWERDQVVNESGLFM
jgi:REP element-mobilizing transposase RayT